MSLDDGLDFGGYPVPPDVPPDPTGDEWRGPPGPPGPPGPAGQDGVPEAPVDSFAYARRNSGWIKALMLAGGTMEGALLLAGAPVQPAEAATKAYVDTAVATGVGAYLPLTGGTLTGPLTITLPGAGIGVQVNASGTAWAQMHFNNTGTGAAGFLQSKRNNLARWSMELGGSSPETGSNAGTNFLLRAFDDAGTTFKDVIQISRATGILTHGAGITFSGVLAGANDDFSKHIRLGTSAFGINLNGPQMNIGYPAIASSQLSITMGGTSVALFDQTKLTVSLPIFSSHITVGTNAAPAAVHVNGPAASNRMFMMQTAGLSRWGMGANVNPESTGNAGSDFTIDRYNDAGTYISSPFTITRASGTVGIVGLANIQNGATFGSQTVSPATDMSKHILLHTGGYGFSVSAGRINHIAPTGGSHNFLINGVDIASVGALGLTAGTNTSAGSLSVNGPAASSRGLYFRTAALTRWVISAENTAEGGANAGSSLYFSRFDDSGNFLDVTLSIVRSSGLVGIGRGLSFGSQLGASNTDLAKHLALYSTTHGLSVTGSRMNYVVPSGSQHAFVHNAVDIMSIVSTGVAITGSLSTTSVINGTTNINAGAALTAKTFVLAGDNTNTGTMTINGPVSTTRQFRWQTAGLARWSLGASTDAEGGSDAGFNFSINRFNDAGTVIETAVSLIRSTGAFIVTKGAGMFNTNPPTSKPAATGAKGGNAALASVIAILVSYGMMSDTTTA